MIRTLTFALALAAVAPLASAKTIEVRFKDLDFSRASDVAEFNARLDKAADALCAKTAGDDNRTMLSRSEIRARCAASVRAQVQAQLTKDQREALSMVVPAAPVEMAGR